MLKDKTNLALKQYQKSIDQSRFKVLAQKLAQHLNNLAQDKNTKIRWIWQLIQNAKDVPNEFGKIKIKIQIYQDKFIFTHNGDPFRVSDLETLVAQYSSKAEQNKTHIQTTGKYGTGFITTYILSRKVRIKGLLKINPKEECVQPEIKQKNQQDPDRFIPDEVMHNQADDEKDFLYQRFQTLLDRTYKDRDNELVQKLIQTEEHLKIDLQKNEPKPKWKRTQNDYNTQFIYEDIDGPGMQMLLPSMNCLKQLFPYALLFNPMLSELYIINKSQNAKIKNLMIKRLEQTQHNGLKFFNARIVQQKKQAYTFSAAYVEDEETFSTIATPVSINEGYIKLLETNNKYPKIFKEFPLIGCQDHGFNFIFTSKKFYPNESRSDLLLNQIEDRPSKKAKQNWAALTGIFEKGLELYKKLAEVISEGQQNLLIVKTGNQFTHPQYKQNGITKILQNYQSTISKLEFIEFRNGQRGTLNKLTLLEGRSQTRNIMTEQYSALLNEKFAPIIGLDRTLSSKNYKVFYQKLIQYNKTWSRSQCQYWNVEKCLNQLSELGFAKLIKRVGNHQKAIKFLLEILQFLQKYHPNSFKNQYRTKYKLLLTNNFILTTYNPSILVKHNLPLIYQNIGFFIGINTNQYTIHPSLSQYFELKTFEEKDIKEKYRNRLICCYKLNAKQIIDDIVRLGRFLCTFNIKRNCFDLISDLKGFQNIEKPFFGTEEFNSNLTLSPQDIKDYTNLFDLKVMKYIDNTLYQTDSLKDLQTLTHFHDRSQTLEWLNKVFKQERALLKDAKIKQIQPLLSLCFFTISTTRKKLIKKNLAVSQKFRDRDLLRYFRKEDSMEKGQEPDEEDIIFLEKMRVLWKRSQQWNLRSNVIHTEIEDTSINSTTFGEQYIFIVDMYNNITTNTEIKMMILDQVYRLRQKAKKDKNTIFKLKAVKSIEKKAYIDYPTFSTEKNRKEHLQNQCQQSYAFHLMRNKQEIDAAIEINQQFGSLINAQATIKLMQLRLKQLENK